MSEITWERILVQHGFYSGQVESVNAIQDERSFDDNDLPRVFFHSLQCILTISTCPVNHSSVEKNDW
ncbi:MAG: hypothetical protein JW915_22035 [Chitinispirillaceae bacterium]|nr:hypothetical protein [Chitinispirillaceae bacterium]